jgi:hypothetical protein
MLESGRRDQDHTSNQAAEIQTRPFGSKTIWHQTKEAAS